MVHGLTRGLQVASRGRLAEQEVWHHPSIPTNILSLSQLRKSHDITYINNTFIATNKTTNHVNYIFQQTQDGLYYYDTSAPHTYITAVKHYKTKFTKQHIKQADGVRRLQQLIGFPTLQQLSSILQHNLLPNCPFTPLDVHTADEIYGPALGALKGKTVRRPPPSVSSNLLPISLPALYQMVTLAGDVMHVNNIPFLVTKS